MTWTPDRSHKDLPNKNEVLMTQTQLRNELIWWTFTWFIVRIQWNTRRPERFIESLLNLYHSLVSRESSYSKNVTYNLAHSTFQFYFHFQEEHHLLAHFAGGNIWWNILFESDMWGWGTNSPQITYHFYEILAL